MCLHLCQILPELHLQMWGPIGYKCWNVEPWPLLLFFVTFCCLEMPFCECPCKIVPLTSMLFCCIWTEKYFSSDGPVETLGTSDAGKCPEVKKQNLLFRMWGSVCLKNLNTSKSCPECCKNALWSGYRLRFKPNGELTPAVSGPLPGFDCKSQPRPQENFQSGSRLEKGWTALV